MGNTECLWEEQLGGWWHKNTSLATSCILYLNQFKIEFFSWKVKEFKSQNNTYDIVPVVGEVSERRDKQTGGEQQRGEQADKLGG